MITPITPLPFPQIEATTDMVAELEQRLDGEAKFDWLTRQIFATDASMYRVIPAGVVFPRHGDDLAAAISIAGNYDIPVVPRGGGTSLSGQAIGNGLVIDLSKYMHRVTELNLEEGWVEVEAGTNLEHLNSYLRPHGLIIGPDPSSAKGNTLGGMTANNSTGTHSILYGMMSDQVFEMDLILANGERVTLGPTTQEMVAQKSRLNTLEGALYRDIPALVDEYRTAIADDFPKTWRNVAGYNLKRLANDETFTLAPLIMGSEGTLASIVNLKIKVVPIPQQTRLHILHFDDIRASLEIVPRLLETDPAAVELLGSVQMEMIRKNPNFVHKLNSFVQGMPSDILMVEYFGESAAEVAHKSRRLKELLPKIGYQGPITDCLTPDEIGNVWSIRRDLFGLVHSRRGEAKPLTFADDATVPVEQLADYVDKVQSAMREIGTFAGFGAHASAGCLHISPVLDVKAEGSLEKVKALSYAIGDAAISLNGTTTGEHGEGFAKGYHNERMFGPRLHTAFKQVKGIFDPNNRMNPGKKIDTPEPWNPALLRYNPEIYTRDLAPNVTFFDFSADHGFSGAIEMCSGQGVCRREEPGVMCPSYRVTRDELHSTRGRANALRAAISGELGADGMYSAELHEALDLCLECKACKHECPSIVDMARLKSEYLAHYQAKVGVPWRSRLFGHIHTVNRIGSRTPGLANWSFKNRLFRNLLDSRLGIDARRELPPLARESFQAWYKKKGKGEAATRGQVVLWDDTYTSFNETEIGKAAVKVLEAARFEVILEQRRRCCGRPMISKGLLAEAQANAEHNIAVLLPYAEQGIPIIGLEPSCMTTFVDEYPDLVQSEAARTVAKQVYFIESFLSELAANGRLDLPFRDAGPREILVHGHCYQKATTGTDPLLKMLRLIPNATVTEIESGCCGMAGSFGYEKEHYALSMACGEDRLFPTVRQAAQETVIAAAGISCRHQITAGTERQAVHPIVILADALAS